MNTISRTCKIGVICSLSGKYQGTGQGYLESVRFAIEKLTIENGNQNPITYELVVKNDNSVTGQAADLYQQCVDEGCLCVLGPNDSAIAHEILLQSPNATVPLFLPLASSSFLSGVNNSIFFRTTSSDYHRCKILTDVICEEYKGKKIHIYAYAGSVYSYAQGLKNDIIRVLENRGMEYSVEDFDEVSLPSKLPPKKTPVIVCAISKHAVMLARHLRENRVFNQIYTFGSNTNLLHTSLLNSIVVCDLDRNDTNMYVRNILRDFHNRYNEKNPSLSTINIIYVIHDYLKKKNFDSTQTLDFNNELKKNTYEGLLGDCSFSREGEYIGKEQLSTLIIRRKKRQFQFSILTQNTVKLNTRSRNDYYRKLAITFIGGLATVATLFELVKFLMSYIQG